jgi:hypothetical protein
VHLVGKRPWHRQLGSRPARTPEAVAGAQWAGFSLGKCQAAQSRLHLLEEAKESGPGKGGGGVAREARLTVLPGEQLAQMVLARPVVARVRVELLEHAVLVRVGVGAGVGVGVRVRLRVRVRVRVT